MGIVIRQSFKATMVSYVGAGIGYINVVFVTPFCLPPEIIGLNRALVDMAIYLAFLSQFGIMYGIIRYFPKYKNTGENFFLYILAIPLIGFIVVSLLFLFLKQYIILYFETNSQLLNEYLNLVLPLTFFMVFLGVFETYSSSLLRIVVPNVVREIILKLLNILIIVLFYLNFLNLLQFLIGIILIYAISVILNLIYILRISNINLRFNYAEINIPLFKQFLKYISFILFLGIGSHLVNKIDVFMISSSINLSNTGIYTIALYITVIIEIPYRVFMQMAGPVVSNAFHQNDTRTIKDVYKRSSLLQFAVGGILFLLVWVNTRNIFGIMPNGEIYEAGKLVILFLGLSKVFDMLTGINGVIIANSKYYVSLFFFTTYLTIITIITNYYLIPLYGITGAAIASLVSLFTYNILLIIFLKVKMDIIPFTIRTLYVLIILIICYSLQFLLPEIQNNFVDLIVRSMLVGGVFVFIIYRFNISGDINAFIDNILDRVRK